MPAIDHSVLTIHLETALATAPLDALRGLHGCERRQRQAATLALASYLADRLGCFEFRMDDGPANAGQAPLFADDLGPIG